MYASLFSMSIAMFITMFMCMFINVVCMFAPIYRDKMVSDFFRKHLPIEVFKTFPVDPDFIPDHVPVMPQSSSPPDPTRPAGATTKTTMRIQNPRAGSDPPPAAPPSPRLDSEGHNQHLAADRYVGGILPRIFQSVGLCSIFFGFWPPSFPT